MRTLIQLGQDIANALEEVETTNQAAPEDAHTIAITDLHTALNRLRRHAGIPLMADPGEGVVALKSSNPNKDNDGGGEG